MSTHTNCFYAPFLFGWLFVYFSLQLYHKTVVFTRFTINIYYTRGFSMYIFIKIAILAFTIINFVLLAKLFIITKEIAAVKHTSVQKYSLVNLTPRQQVLIDKDVSAKINIIIISARKIKKIIFLCYIILFLLVISLFLFNI